MTAPRRLGKQMFLQPLLVLLAGLYGVWSGGPAFAGTQDNFKFGVDAYRAGKPEAAAAYFESAKDSGLNTSVLYFNLGLCYYQLGQDLRAAEYFGLAGQSPQFAAIADYHLALLAFREGKNQDALRRLDAAVAGDAQLSERADVVREKITGETIRPRTSIYLSAAGGYDSNATLGSDIDTSTVMPHPDGFGEFLGAIEHDRARFGLTTAVYYRRYGQETAFDQLVASLDALRQFSFTGWFGSFGIGGAGTWIGDARFQENYGPRFALESRNADAWHPFVRYQGDWISAVANYGYLTGWRHRLELSARHGKNRAGYEFELNDRRDLSQGEEFFSESPLRHRLFADFELGSASAVTFVFSAQLRRSDYRQADRILVNGMLQEARRRETLESMGLQAYLPVLAGIRPFAGLKGTINRASPDDLSYRRVEALIGGEWVN